MYAVHTYRGQSVEVKTVPNVSNATHITFTWKHYEVSYLAYVIIVDLYGFWCLMFKKMF